MSAFVSVRVSQQVCIFSVRVSQQVCIFSVRVSQLGKHSQLTRKALAEQECWPEASKTASDRIKKNLEEDERTQLKILWKWIHTKIIASVEYWHKKFDLSLTYQTGTGSKLYESLQFGK